MARLSAQDYIWRQATEEQVQDTLLGALRVNWWAESHHPDSRRVKGPGIPDLVALRPGEVLFLEVKREVRARWYPRQQLWRFGLEASPGVEYWLVKPSTLDAVLRRLRAPMRGGKVVNESWMEQLRVIREQEAVSRAASSSRS